MKIVEISYNPYKMTTKMFIDEIDVCKNSRYSGFANFIEQGTPLQSWIEPIKHLNWKGFVNEISDVSTNDEVTIVFSGRTIDFRDLKHAIKTQNDKREKRTRVKYIYEHKKILDDKELSKNIEEVVSELKSDKFAELVKTRTTGGLTKKYNDLEKNYSVAKDSEFHIVLAGVYSSGKSTLLNTLIRHDVLPTSDNTCTSKNCRIKHDSSLGEKISLTCYDDEGNIVVEKKVFEDDSSCKTLFEEISPIDAINELYSKVVTMELGVDLSHLYPDSVSEDKFTIVLIDTPGMDSAQSSVDGVNKHAEIALDAISDESKPMIILCAEATKYEDDSIGEFMRDVVSHSKDDGGFNDRYLFLMNKSDSISYRANESAEKAKITFAKYLTDSTKWNIKGDEDELRELAANAEKFVPRVFMTAALMAWGIYDGADDYPIEVLKTDSFKRDLKNKLKNFVENVTVYEDENLYLSQYCDIPDYRKEEIKKEFKEAIEANDDIRAAELQCGIISVERAIRDYIERYAFPVKVRDLLATFEDILVDVKSFAEGSLKELMNKENEMGEKSGERKGAREKKKSAEQNKAALEEARAKTDEQMSELNKITFNSEALNKARTDFKTEIEADEDVLFIRSNPVVKTGQKTRAEVEAEILERTNNIKIAFNDAFSKISQKLKNMSEEHNKQISAIYDILKKTILDLEKSGILKQDNYDFKDGVLWKTFFKNIDSKQFANDIKEHVVDRTSTSEKKEIDNDKKWDWRYSRNPFKKFGSLFMSDKKTITVMVPVDGYYETQVVLDQIDDYYNDLKNKSDEMEKDFIAGLNKSKDKVRDLIEDVLLELKNFNNDIIAQNELIYSLSGNISALRKEIKKRRQQYDWLNELKLKIEGE